jgi:ATP-dependent DNA ligase
MTRLWNHAFLATIPALAGTAWRKVLNGAMKRSWTALAFKTGGKLSLRSRNDNDFALRYPSIAKALASLPDDTAVDGEIVALDEAGKPSFNALQNYGSSKPDLIYYIFDVMVLAGKDVTTEPLAMRRDLLEKKVLPKLAEPIRYSPSLDASLADLVQSVKAQGFEGLVAKQQDSKYQPGLRTGAWQKMRVNQGQELVIAGYTPSSKNFDALVIGEWTDVNHLSHTKFIALRDDKKAKDVVREG